MHIERQTTDELVVVSGSRWVSAICAVGALCTVYLVIVRDQPTFLFLTGFLLLFALIMDLRKTFTFDAMQRVVRWSGRKVFKAESGVIPFDEIDDIVTETGSASSRSGRDIPLYRLAIATPQATIPMSYTLNAEPDGYSALRGQILDFVKPGSALQFTEVGGTAARRE